MLGKPAVPVQVGWHGAVRAANTLGKEVDKEGIVLGFEPPAYEAVSGGGHDLEIGQAKLAGVKGFRFAQIAYIEVVIDLIFIPAIPLVLVIFTVVGVSDVFLLILVIDTRAGAAGAEPHDLRALDLLQGRG